MAEGLAGGNQAIALLGNTIPTDNGGDENGGAQGLREKTPGKWNECIAHWAATAAIPTTPFNRPIRSSSFRSATSDKTICTAISCAGFLSVRAGSRHSRTATPENCKARGGRRNNR
jgi:hypothetical protein